MAVLPGPRCPRQPAADLGDPRPRFPSSLAHLPVDLGPPRPTAQTVTSTSQNVEDQMLATIKAHVENERLKRDLKKAQQQAEEEAASASASQVENETLKRDLKKAQQQAEEEAASASASKLLLLFVLPICVAGPMLLRL
eukprot:g16187.t1